MQADVCHLSCPLLLVRNALFTAETTKLPFAQSMYQRPLRPLPEAAVLLLSTKKWRPLGEITRKASISYNRHSF